MTLEFGDPQNLINTPALVRLIATTGDEIRAVKKALRSTWTKLMHDEQRTLISLKHRATMLCALRALSRGRLHIAVRPKRGFGPMDVWEARAYNKKLAQAALDRLELRRPDIMVRVAQ